MLAELALEALEVMDKLGQLPPRQDAVGKGQEHIRGEV